MIFFFQIQDTSASPTLSRLLTAGLNKGGSLKSERSGSGGSGEGGQAGADSLCVEMNDLMHDYEVMSRISDLVGQLKGTYEVSKTNFASIPLDKLRRSRRYFICEKLNCRV